MDLKIIKKLIWGITIILSLMIPYTVSAIEPQNRLDTNIIENGIYKVTKENTNNTLLEGDYKLQNLTENSIGHIIILDSKGEIRFMRRFDLSPTPQNEPKAYFKLKEGEQLIIIGNGKYYIDTFKKGVDY